MAKERESSSKGLDSITDYVELLEVGKQEEQEMINVGIFFLKLPSCFVTDWQQGSGKIGHFF